MQNKYLNTTGFQFHWLIICFYWLMTWLMRVGINRCTKMPKEADNWLVWLSERFKQITCLTFNGDLKGFPVLPQDCFFNPEQQGISHFSLVNRWITPPFLHNKNQKYYYLEK